MGLEVLFVTAEEEATGLFSCCCERGEMPEGLLTDPTAGAVAPLVLVVLLYAVGERDAVCDTGDDLCATARVLTILFFTAGFTPLLAWDLAPLPMDVGDIFW